MEINYDYLVFNRWFHYFDGSIIYRIQKISSIQIKLSTTE